jgi:hypothetical protein
MEQEAARWADKQPINLSSVDLPPPEGPTSVTNSFCLMVRLICVSAVTRPLFDAYVLSKP